MTPASPRPRVLLVDGDVQARLVFEVTLKASGFEVLVSSQGEEALSLLTRETVDVVVAETELAELDGFQLCTSLRARPEAARMLIVLLSADRTQRNRARMAGSGADDFLLKPAYAHELDQRLRALLRRRQRERLMAGQDEGQPLGGSLSEVAVVDLLSLIEQSGRSGVLTLRGPSGGRGELYFRQGRVVDAEVGHLSGPEGVYRMLAWSTGSFVLEWKNIRRRDAVAMSTADILLEGLRRLDEWNRLLEGLPGISGVYEVDYRRLADHLAEIPDEVNALLRLFDGVRSLAQVIEDSGFSDLDALRVIRRLVESRILNETHPAEAGSVVGPSNPVFDGWQPEVGAPLSEMPPMPAPEPIPESRTGSIRILPAPAPGLPAPPQIPAVTSTNPGLGPHEPEASPERGTGGRMTALGMPTLEPPVPPLTPVPPPSAADSVETDSAESGSTEPDSSEDAFPASAVSLSLDMAEEPEASFPNAVLNAESAQVRVPEHAQRHPEEEVVPLPMREQTQIFSHNEAMDELGIAPRRGRWALAFLAAMAAVALGLFYRSRQGTGEDRAAASAQADAALAAEQETAGPHAEAEVAPPSSVASPPLAKVDEGAAADRAAADRAAADRTAAVKVAAPPPVELPGSPAPGLGREGKGPAETTGQEHGNPSLEGTGSPATKAPAGEPNKAISHGVSPAHAGPMDQGAHPAAPAGVPAAAAGTAAAEAPADFKGDPVKALSDCKTAFAAGRFRQAFAACGDATKGNPTSSAAFAMLAHAQLNRDKPNEALAAAQKAIALDPNQADAYVIVGGVEQDRGHSAAAKAAYLKYLQLAPRGRYAPDLRAIVGTL